jgi:ATP-dependent helicase/nuclease subunit A
LLLPLLEELAAGNDERARSVFLVGDKKQSIYSFRRANPALLGEASGWLADRLQAENYPLDASRRSAQAIIDLIA